MYVENREGVEWGERGRKRERERLERERRREDRTMEEVRAALLCPGRVHCRTVLRAVFVDVARQRRFI